jgi:hypothetical protein
MDLSSVKPVVAAEDIYASNGMKLVVKGTRMSDGMQERLILHRLKKPLETSIEVQDGVGKDRLQAAARQLVDRVPSLHPVLGDPRAGDYPLNLLEQVPLNGAYTLLLSLIERDGDAALQHCVVVSLIAGGLARQTGQPSELVMAAVQAGLFHDVGELYINPRYLHPDYPLKPAEWRHLVVHPVVGQKLLDEIGGCKRAVSQAVLEHHERLDGYGYPRRLAGSEIGTPGQLLAAAEEIADMFLQYGRPLERADLALRIMRGEHSREVVALLSHALARGRAMQRHEAVMSTNDIIDAAHDLLRRVSAAVHLYHELVENHAMNSPAGGALLSQAADRINLIQSAFSSAGLDWLDRGASVEDEDVRFEICLVIGEINNRLSSLARDLALRVGALTPEEQTSMAGLIELLYSGESTAAS